MNKLNICLILFVLLILTIGCLGPSANADKCKGIIKFDGKTFEGAAENKEQAELNTCNKFCLETDSEFEAMYNIWLDSADGKAFVKKMKGKPTKQEAIFENRKLLDYVTKNCAPRCVQGANKGKHSLETKCR